MKKIIVFIVNLFLLSQLIAQDSTVQVYHFFIDDNIAKPSLRKTEKAIERAQELGADLIILRLNTFGGELESAEKIRTMLLECPIPIYVLIDPNAASAGALISIACDSIYMVPGATIGAASVVDQAGDVLPDKYQSYMRGMMRSTAEQQGRNPLIAEAMVDPDTHIPDITELGKVLTFTTKEAIQHGYCEGEVNNEEELLAHVGIANYEITEQTFKWTDKVIAFLINPAISGILIMLIIGGIYFELQTPGIGFPLIVAVIAALLYFMPHYIEGLAAHWEILLFLVGVGLLIVEIFVTPGFGVAGISGIVLIVTSLVLAMVFNIGFDFTFVPPKVIPRTILIVLTSVIGGFLVSLWVAKKLLGMSTRFGSLALKTNLSSEDGYVSADMSMAQQIGKNGTAITMLRPAGKVEIEGEIYDAVSALGFIDQGTPIAVMGFENAQLVVEKM
ncbi:MAG: nodulation protein NfeD [Bacteroidales bacterium]|jgi:membrane-bound serine protease (ClpP class)|nr:nodulation protein NfeD [Bacteroidales bacterium]